MRLGAKLMLEKLEIEHNAIEYIEKELNFAGRFGKSVAETIDLDKGRVYVYLPLTLQSFYKEFQDSILGVFREIGDEGVDKETVIGEITTKPHKIVFQFLKNNTSGCAIFETFYLSRDVSHIHTKDWPYITHKGEVFWFLDHENANFETINQCFKSRKAYPSVVGLSYLPETLIINNKDREVQNENFKLIVERIDCLLVGAYDEETFLIWVRDT
jgi:hypothetical protein